MAEEALPRGGPSFGAGPDAGAAGVGRWQDSSHDTTHHETRPPAAAELGMRASRLVYDGRIVRLSIDTVRFPDGSEGDLEMIRHSGAAAVLPVKNDVGADDPAIILIRQYRYAAGGYMLEVPAGRPDAPGEDWETCARRELREETGLTADRLTRLTTIYTTPGFTDERVHLFMATGLTPGDRTLDPDEFVEPIEMPLSHALEHIRRGEISDAKTICTILYTSTFLRTH